MQNETKLHGNEGNAIHIELRDFNDVLELATGIHATIVHRFCEGADCDKCKETSEKGLCKSGSCAAAIVDYLRSESRRKKNDQERTHRGDLNVALGIDYDDNKENV